MVLCEIWLPVLEASINTFEKASWNVGRHYLLRWPVVQYDISSGKGGVVEVISIVADFRMPLIEPSYDAYLLKLFVVFTALIALGVSIVLALAYILVKPDSDVHDPPCPSAPKSAVQSTID
jgi:hypothetical protein